MNPFREIHTFWTKTGRDLPLGKKIEWLLTYYGVGFVVAIVLIAVVTSLVFAVFGPKDKAAYSGMVLCGRSLRSQETDINRELEELLGESVQVSCYLADGGQEAQAFAIRLGTDDLAFVMVPKAEAELITQTGRVSGWQEVSTTFGETLYLGFLRPVTTDRQAAVARYFEENLG